MAGFELHSPAVLCVSNCLVPRTRGSHPLCEPSSRLGLEQHWNQRVAGVARFRDSRRTCCKLRRRALAIEPTDQFAANDVVVAADEDDSPLPHALKGIYMAKLRLGYLLVSTAITVVAFTATSVRAAPDARAVLAAAIPAPEPADM